MRDVRMGIIEELPATTPAKWCHKMVDTSKPGSPKPRGTVDMSALKTASYRLTHPGAPPFLEAQGVYKFPDGVGHVQIQEDAHGGPCVHGCLHLQV